MTKRRCKDCIKFCTDDCKYREDVDTMTFACSAFWDKELYTAGGSDAYCSSDMCPIDLERDKWTK